MTPAMTQDKLSELYEREKQKGNPHPTDAPLIQAIITRGYDFRNQNRTQAEKLRDFLQKGFRIFPNTLTRVSYSPSGDRVVHNHGTSDEYSINGNVVGPSGWMKYILDKRVLESLLGTKDVKKINKVSQWVNGTDSYLWRLNSKPTQKDERVVGFDADDCGLVLDCDWDPLNEYPAFRVLCID